MSTFKIRIRQFHEGCIRERRWLITFLVITVFATASSSYSDVVKKPVRDVRLTTEELKLYNLVMEYRQKKGLKKIPLSRSLTFVAQSHVFDLETNNPVTKKCNIHSWSGKGEWKPCCYTEDHNSAKCMWDKPGELTSYKANAYEIAAAATESIDPGKALSLWKESKHHNNVILNKSIWAKMEWKAIGIGINGKYAVVWFGNQDDPDDEPTLRNN